MRHRKTLALAAGATAVAAGIVSSVVLVGHDGGDPTPTARHAGARGALLAELQTRLVPAASGGWVAATPSTEPALDVWVKAAGAEPQPTGSFDELWMAAGEAVRPSAADGAIDLALAEVLPGPSPRSPLAQDLVDGVYERARSGVERGEGTALAVLLQLSAGESDRAVDATALLAERIGDIGCDRLPGPGAPVPDPAGSLTVALRVLAGTGQQCPGAADVLAATLDAPRWQGWIAVSEQRDLALLAGTLPDDERVALVGRLASLLVVEPGQTIDVGAPLAVRNVRRTLGIEGSVPPVLRAHLAGQVATRGGLPGRSSSPPTAFDAAILRQLVASHRVAPDLLDETLRALPPPAGRGAYGPIIDGVLASGDRPACGAVPAPSAVERDNSLDAVVGREIAVVVRAWCRGDERLERLAVADRSEVDRSLRALRLAGRLLGLCQVARDRVTDDLATVVPRGGVFQEDSTVVWARSISADPTAACAAAWATA